MNRVRESDSVSKRLEDHMMRRGKEQIPDAGPTAAASFLATDEPWLSTSLLAQLPVLPDKQPLTLFWL